MAFSSPIKHWIPLALVTTALCGLVYVSVQQTIRSAANEPQVQLAEDTAAAMSRGEDVTFRDAHVDIATDLAPFVVIYDKAGTPISATGFLDGEMPLLPSGIFTYLEHHDQDRVTWQPRSGVRSAIVVTKYTSTDGDGFVMAGRSLREVEKRTLTLMLQVTLVWGATLVLTLVACTRLGRKNPTA